MTIKWKIFRVSNYVHLVCALCFQGLAIYDLLSSAEYNSIADFILSGFVIASLLVLVANATINLVILERFYPDKQPGNKLALYHNLSFGLSIPVLFIGTVFTCLVIFWSAQSQPIEQEMYNVDTESIVLMLVMMLCIVSGIYNLFLEQKLRKTIKQNYEESLNSFLA